MNAEEHFAEAERLTALAEGVDWGDGPARRDFARTVLACAQVHATLALVIGRAL